MAGVTAFAGFSVELGGDWHGNTQENEEPCITRSKAEGRKMKVTFNLWLIDMMALCK